MPGADLSASATARSSVLAQYRSGANLRSRVSVYEYLEPVPSGGVDFGPWVLDHIAWSGTEVALDVGCWPGRPEPGLSARAAMVVGLDISPGMLREHRDHRPSMNFVQADAVGLPARAGSFDVVLAAHMLYHLSDVERTLAEVCRVLKRGEAFLADKTTQRVASDPWCKRAPGVGSFRSYQLTKEDPHPWHYEYRPPRPSAPRSTTSSPATAA